MATSNEIWVNSGQRLEQLDLLEDTALLPTFCANDRGNPSQIQSDYSPEFEAPATAHNHWLLRHAAASQPTPGQAYVRMPCVLTSGGVEIMPLGILLVKGYKEGKYQLQLVGGNKRFVEALGEKKLSDLKLERFNHYWTSHEIDYRLGYPYWQTFGWGYSLFDRGKAFDLQALDPFLCYPTVAALLVLEQLIADAGFTANSLRGEPLAAQLDIPSANPYTFPQAYRDARRLQAGYFYGASGNYYHNQGFEAEKLVFSYVSRAPYHAPEATTGSTYFGGDFQPDTLGYYDLGASISCFFGCNDLGLGKVRVKFLLKLNGQPFLDENGNEIGTDEMETRKKITHTFTPKLNRWLLHPNDVVSLHWEGGEIGTAPSNMVWSIGPYGAQETLPGGQLNLATEVQMTCVLLAEFPQGGLVRLQDWLPDMKQLDFFKSMMVLLNLTIESDPYEPRLAMTPGSQTLANVKNALNWTNKRDSYARPGRSPERELSYRLGKYSQVNNLKWTEDERVKKGYGDGVIYVADQVLPASTDLLTLPFAATEPSPTVSGFLQILNFEVQDRTSSPPTYSTVEAKPRLTLRRPGGEVGGNLIMKPAVGNTPATLQPFLTTASYFAGAQLSLDLNNTVLTYYWQDTRATLAETRVLSERYRLTTADIIGLRFNTPIWDGYLGDYFLVSKIVEFDQRRSVAVELVRLNAAFLPPPIIPGEGTEFWSGEFETSEWY